MSSPALQPAGCSVESVTRWCLEHLDAFAAVLVGVEAGAGTAEFHIVPLRAEDLFADVASLSIPRSWHTLVVVADGPLLDAEPGIRIGVGAGRNGVTHVERRHACAAAPNRAEGGR